MFIIIASFIFIALLISTFFNPFIGLIGFTVSLYLKFAAYNPLLYYFHITRLLGIIILIVILVKGRNRKIHFFDSRQSKWLLMLFSLMIFTIFTSIWRGNTVDFLGDFLKIVIAYFLVVNIVDSPQRLRLIIWTMVLSMLYCVLVSIKAYYASGAIYEGGRMFGGFSGALFGDPNDMAMGMIILIPFLYFDLFGKKGFVLKISEILIIAVFLWGIVLTQSRGGFLGFGVMLACLWLKSKRKVLIFLLGIFVCIGLWQASPQAFKDRMMTIETAKEQDGSAIIRLNAWQAGLNMMTHHLFGVGAGNFREGFVRYRPLCLIDFPWKRRVAHNMFVEVGGEMGFPGLIIFLTLIFSSLKAFYGIKKKIIGNTSLLSDQAHEIIVFSDAGFISLVSYCSAGMFLSQNYNFILYYLIAFSVVLERLATGYFEKLREAETSAPQKKKEKEWKSKAVSGQLADRKMEDG